MGVAGVAVVAVVAGVVVVAEVAGVAGVAGVGSYPVITRNPTAEESHKIATALVAARLLRPYYGRAIAALTPVVAEGLATMAVDAHWRLYLGEKVLHAWTATNIGGCIAAHEVEHLLRHHAARQRAIIAPPLAWNIAADAEINDDAEAGVLDAACVTPSMLGQPQNLLAEEYLRAMQDAAGSSAAGILCDGGSGAGRPLDGELPEGSAPWLNEAEAERLRDQVASDVVSAARARSDAVTKSALMWAEARAAKVKIDWRRLLRSAIVRSLRTSTIGRDDYSWSRLSRRWRHQYPMRPGLRGHRPRIGLVLDVSGSMTDHGNFVLGAVVSLCRSAAEIAAWQVDTTVTRIRGPILRAKWRGGGGTDLRPAISMASEHCDTVVVVTDCETPWPKMAEKPTVVVATAPDQCGPSWATTVHAEATP